MPEPITPPAATPAPAAAPAGGGNQPAAAAPAATPAPITYEAGEPTDPIANREWWKARHGEATGTLTKAQQAAAKYRETYGELPPDGGAPAATTPNPNQPALPANVWTEEKQRNWEIQQDIARTPSLVPHNEEVVKLVQGGLQLGEAKEIVAKRHNIVMQPTMDAGIEMMPVMPGGGGLPSSNGANVAPEHEASLAREGKSVESAKKHMPAVNQAWRKALKR